MQHQGLNNIEYVGGGIKGRHVGFQISQPKKITPATKEVKIEVQKKQKKFKKVTKQSTIGQDMAKINDDISNSLGIENKATAQIKKDINKERTKFKSFLGKSATALKKSLLIQGGTKKKVNEEKKRHENAVKESLKKAILHHTLQALKEFNNRLN